MISAPPFGRPELPPGRNGFARLALESARADCLVVGEDLGTAPEGFHDTLEKAAALVM